MLKINNQNIDLIVQCEEYTRIEHIFNLINLDVTEILVVCPELFLQRFIQSNQEEFSIDVLETIEKELEINNTFISIDLSYKKKIFHFHFILTGTSKKIINNPFKGEQIFNVGFKKINIK